ncbi:MAG: PKD domain-containing protein, partial [Cyclobacteriaceae bacterium]|nr:PKD domain-containing protein [Cyclobacteriaceae bacterium]
KPVTIASSPTADFTVGPACANQLTRFTDTSTGGVQSHQWQIGPVSFGVVNPSYTFTSSGTFNATLTVTAANGCSNVKTRIVNVPVVPTQNFTVTNACAGKNTSFTDATSSPQDPVTGWNWNFAGSSTTGNPASYGFLSPGTFNTKLTTTHASGCRYTLSRDVLINPTPVASFTATPDRGAAPLTVQFNNTSQGATQYAWRFEDKVPATSARISPVYTFATLGDYSAQLTATNAQGCADILTMPIRVLVPVIDLVLTDFSMTTDPITGKLKGIVTIQNKSNVPVGPVEVALYLADKAVVNENLSMDLAPEASITKTLSFSLTQEQFDLGFLCAKIISEKDVQPDNNKRCINLNDADVTFRPYPNPTSGTLHVDWVTTQPGTAIIAIRNGVGKKVYEWETISQTGLNQTVHDVAFLSSGLYFLTIETGANRRTTRFFRQ